MTGRTGAVSQLDANQCQIRLKFEDGRLRGFGYTETTLEAQAAEYERQPRVYERVVDGRRAVSEATGLLADCLHAPLQWIREKEGALLGVATRRDPFNSAGMLADLLPALTGVRWDPCTGLWSTVDLFSSEEGFPQSSRAATEGFGLDQL